jgi:hypothetical protein
VEVPESSSVTLEVFTVAFRKVASLTVQAYGPKTLLWDLKDISGVQVANGVYYAQISVRGSQSATKILKVMVLR